MEFIFRCGLERSSRDLSIDWGFTEAEMFGADHLACIDPMKCQLLIALFYL